MNQSRGDALNGEEFESYSDGHLLPLAGLDGVHSVGETLGDLRDLIWLRWSQLDLSIAPEMLQLWLRKFDGAWTRDKSMR